MANDSGVLAGVPTVVGRDGAKTPDSKAARKHPQYEVYADDEKRQRATFIATLRSMVSFLIPHTYEGDDPGRRALFGWAPGLNRRFIQQLMGHVRAQEVRRSWPPLSAPKDRQITGAPTEGSIAALLFSDATADGVSWDNFFRGRVMEWLLSSPGGFVLVDQPAGKAETMAEAFEKGLRPSVRFVPFSEVWAFEFGRHGFTRVKLVESEFDADPLFPGTTSTGNVVSSSTVVVYSLDPEDGHTVFARYDIEDNLLDRADLPRFENPQGQPILPLVPVKWGEHAAVAGVGEGLLSGLADLVIDRYNIVNEMRAGSRDMTFAVDFYRGTDYAAVVTQREAGSRMVNIGTDPNAQLGRIGADPSEVTVTIQQLQVNLEEWVKTVSEKSDALSDSPQTRSGVAIQAEFQLAMKPILTLAARELDAIEEQVMYIVAQFQGESPAAAFAVSVETNVDFRMENEADHVAGVLEAAQRGDLRLPPELLVAAVMTFAEAAPELFGDMSDKIEGGRRRWEIVEAQARQMFEGALDEDTLRAGNARENNIAVLAVAVRDMLEADGLLGGVEE
jgi:hypothetical protein